MKLSFKQINSPFLHPFTISKGTKTHQPALLVELEYFGHRGYGEAPAISYYNIPVEKMILDLEIKKKFIEQFSFSDPERDWHYLHHLLPQNSFLVCALDMAAWDLYAKMKRKNLSEIWKTDLQLNPVTDYTIGIDSPEKMKQKILEKPWPVYKIKMGFDGDVEVIRSLREITNAPFRVDVNGGWTLEDALEKIKLLQDLNIELIEQPLSKDNWEEMKILKERSFIPLIADESCVKEEDVEKCAAYFHGVNIKLTKCSGITPARRMITQAKSLGLKVMLGCMNETSLGTAALVQLAADADYLDADGPLLLAEDSATGLMFEAGKTTGDREWESS